MRGDELEKECEPAIWFRPRTDGASSFTKLGGLPDLPDAIEWPRQSETGLPLHFLAQVDLSQLPPTPLALSLPALPKSGFLYFFADLDDEMLWGEQGSPQASVRVIHGHQSGSRRSLPHDMPMIFHRFGEKDGGYNTEIFEYPEIYLRHHVLNTFSMPEFQFQDLQEYVACMNDIMIASIEEAIGEPLPVVSESFTVASAREYPHEHIVNFKFFDGDNRRELECPLHQMLGVGKNVQGTAEEYREEGHILLLQLDSDLWIHEHFMFCDMGVAQFWIKPDDLAEGRFESAWATTEGG